MLGAADSAKATGYFLLNFGHADGSLCEIVRKWNGEIADE